MRGFTAPIILITITAFAVVFVVAYYFNKNYSQPSLSPNVKRIELSPQPSVQLDKDLGKFNGMDFVFFYPLGYTLSNLRLESSDVLNATSDPKNGLGMLQVQKLMNSVSQDEINESFCQNKYKKLNNISNFSVINNRNSYGCQLTLTAKDGDEDMVIISKILYYKDSSNHKAKGYSLEGSYLSKSTPNKYQEQIRQSVGQFYLE